MPDFYENLSRLENEAMRRARKIGEAERSAARQFHPSPPPAPPRPPAPPPPGNGLFGSALLRSDLLRSPDLGLIITLMLILNAEQSDPLLMLALMYILM